MKKIIFTLIFVLIGSVGLSASDISAHERAEEIPVWRKTYTVPVCDSHGKFEFLEIHRNEAFMTVRFRAYFKSLIASPTACMSLRIGGDHLTHFNFLMSEQEFSVTLLKALKGAYESYFLGLACRI